jgi:hypothetical protein
MINRISNKYISLKYANKKPTNRNVISEKEAGKIIETIFVRVE